MTQHFLHARAPLAFIMAGLFMLAQVLFIGLTRLGIGAASELIAAGCGLVAVFASLLGLAALYSRLCAGSPRLAKAMAVLVVAATLMMLAAITMLLVSHADEHGTAVTLPPAVLGIIGGFLLAYVASFALAAIGGLKAGTKSVAGLLLVPVVCWGTIIIVGAVGIGTEALKLEIYLNVVMAIGFLALAASLRSRV